MVGSLKLIHLILNFQVRKHTALGRFHHENAAMGLTNDGRVVVYMGDDVKDACVYKYISKGTYENLAGKANSKLIRRRYIICC